MFNKELLMAGATGKEPHILITVQRYYDSDAGAKCFGYNAYAQAGKVSRIPCWGGYGTMQKHTALHVLATNAGLTLETMIHWRNPYTSNRIVVTRLDTEKSVVFVNPATPTKVLFATDFLFTAAEIGKEVPLIFDPPPDYYLDPTTDKPI